MRIARVTLSVALALIPTIPGAAVPSSQRAAQTAPKKMTNADIIEMVSAGLSDSIVIGAVKQAPAKGFDLSPSGLVALKKAGASDALILFMQTGEVPPAPVTAPAPPAASSASPLRTAPPPAAGNVPAVVRAEDGVYYFDGQSVVRVEAKTPYQTRTGSKAVSRLTLGIKKARLNAMLPGLSSDLQVGQTPQFYVHLAESESIGEYYLLRFTPKQQYGRRELEVGSAGLGKAQAGFAEKDIYLLDVRRLDKDMYLVTPKIGLNAGEYGLLVVPQATASSQTGLTPRKIFDFGVR